MIKSLNSNSKKFNKELNKFLNLRIKNINLRNSKVFKIVDDVKKNGDKALIKYEKKFNANSKINISNLDIKKCIKKLDNKVRKSIDLAYNRIIKYHSNQKFNGFKTKDKLNNKFEYKFFPIEKVGIYVPGGTASYPSTVLMNAIPALLAKVKKIRIRIFHENLWKLWLDFRIILGLIKRLPEDSVQRSKVIECANDAINGYADNQLNVNISRNILKKELSKHSSASDLKVNAIGHAHIDTAWLWPVTESIRKCAFSLSSIIGLDLAISIAAPISVTFRIASPTSSTII